RGPRERTAARRPPRWPRSSTRGAPGRRSGRRRSRPPTAPGDRRWFRGPWGARRVCGAPCSTSGGPSAMAGRRLFGRGEGAVCSRMRILITGGAGFIGSHVAAAALAAGHEVAVVDDLSTGKRENVPPNVHFYEVDLRHREATERALEDFRPTVVSHQAAQASVSVSMRDPALDAEVNLLGGIHLADACVRLGVERLVFASTGGAIYGEVAENTLAAEDHGTAPISPYAIHKLAYEQ